MVSLKGNVDNSIFLLFFNNSASIILVNVLFCLGEILICKLCLATICAQT